MHYYILVGQEASEPGAVGFSYVVWMLAVVFFSFPFFFFSFFPFLLCV